MNLFEAEFYFRKSDGLAPPEGMPERNPGGKGPIAQGPGDIKLLQSWLFFALLLSNWHDIGTPCLGARNFCRLPWLQW